MAEGGYAISVTVNADVCVCVYIYACEILLSLSC